MDTVIGHGARRRRRILAGGVKSYADLVLESSPLLYWRLDETAGATAEDASGNGRDGTYVNTPTLGQDPLIQDGKAVLLDPAQNEEVTRAKEAWMQTMVDGDWSVEMWVKPTDVTLSDQFGFLIPCDVGQCPILWYDSERMQFKVAHDGAFYIANYLTGATKGATYHFVGRRNTDGDVALWVNGEEKATKTGALGPHHPLTDGLRVGGDHFLDGVIDEFALYGSYLADSVIEEHYAVGSGA